MTASEIRYQASEYQKQILNLVQSWKKDPNRASFNSLLTFLPALVVEVVLGLNSIGSEIAAELADLREATMEKTGTIRVPDVQRIRPQLGSLGGELRCTTCRKVEELTSAQIEAYVVEGWPTCCGLVMLWTTRKELEQQAQQRAEYEQANPR